MPGNAEARNFNYSDVESIVSVDTLYTNYGSNKGKFIQNGCDDSNNKL